MKNFKVMTLGASGAGKTVFLASMFKALSTQKNSSFKLDVEDPQKRKLLNSIYTQILTGDTWPPGTKDISEWTFTCQVQTENLDKYNACQFTYFDYAGGRLTDAEKDPDLEKVVQEIRYKIGEIHLDQAHEYLQDKYREFWYEDKLGISRVNNLDEVTSESNNKFKLLEPLVITPRPQSPEHELSVNEKYSSIEFSRNNTSWLKPVLITITSLFLILILIGIGLSLQKNPICLYSIEDVPLKQKLQIEDLENLKRDHPQAWIFLNGQLQLNVSDYESLADSILNEKKKFTTNNNKKSFTIEPDNKLKIFNIKNYPIELAIKLLQNIKKIKDIKTNPLENKDPFKATIIEPISPEKSECKISGG